MTTAVRVAENLVAERTGIELGGGLRERLAAHLDEAASARGLTPARFAAGLAGDPGAFQQLLDRVTVQETGFFRHPDQFAALAREVLPALDGPAVVWSAGCANGQEAYSLAMELAASGLPDWRVVATDISATRTAVVTGPARPRRPGWRPGSGRGRGPRRPRRAAGRPGACRTRRWSARPGRWSPRPGAAGPAARPRRPRPCR